MWLKYLPRYKHNFHFIFFITRCFGWSVSFMETDFLILPDTSSYLPQVKRTKTDRWCSWHFSSFNVALQHPATAIKPGCLPYACGAFPFWSWWLPKENATSNFLCCVSLSWQVQSPVPSEFYFQGNSGMLAIELHLGLSAVFLAIHATLAWLDCSSSSSIPRKMIS